MDYKTLDELNELIEKELKKMVEKGDLSPNELQAAEKAVCLMEKIIGLEEGTYSQSYRMPMNSYGRSYGYYDRYMDDASYEREVLQKYIRMIRADER